MRGHGRQLEQRRQCRRIRQVYFAQTDPVAHEYRQRVHGSLGHQEFNGSSDVVQGGGADGTLARTKGSRGATGFQGFQMVEF